MTPQWVTTETTSKITVKGLFVVVLVDALISVTHLHIVLECSSRFFINRPRRSPPENNTRIKCRTALLDGYRSPTFNLEIKPVNLELAMFVTAKIHVVSGMVIGALAIMVAKQMCKQKKTHKHSAVPTDLPQE